MDEQQELRAEAIRYDRGSVAIEGFVLPPECEEVDRQFIAGEISTAEHTAAYGRIARGLPAKIA